MNIVLTRDKIFRFKVDGTMSITITSTEGKLSKSTGKKRSQDQMKNIQGKSFLRCLKIISSDFYSDTKMHY